MTLTIGRFATARDPAAFNYDGDNLTFAGMLFAASLDDLDVQRQQLLGLDGNEDEPDVPVTWTRDDGINGYYTVRSVTVTPIKAITYNQFKFQYAVQLERVQGGFAAPLCEVAASFALRTNAHSVTSSVHMLSIPSVATFKQASDARGNFASLSVWRVTDTGSVQAFDMTTASGSFLAATFALPPVSYYVGAVLIEQSVGGVWYPVVGDQIGDVVGNLLRINNGMIRATFHTDGVISTEVFATTWESATSFQLTTSTGGLGVWGAEGGWRILRNSPETCVVQTSAKTQSGSSKRTVTFSLDRGEVLLDIAADRLYYPLIAGGATDTAVTLKAVTVTAATALTGGIRQTSNDASGNRWMMMCPSAVTKDLVNGSLTIAAPGVPLTAQFGLGWERDGSGAPAGYDSATAAGAYFTAYGARQRVVAR